MNEEKRGDVRFGIATVDAILPKDMAKRAEAIGFEKAAENASTLVTLAAMAGAYIAFGATFAATVSVGLEEAVSPGFERLIGGLAFSLAYVLAVVGGAELFTTNNMMVMAWAHGRLSTLGLLRAWGIVFAGNFIGAVATAAMLVLAGQYTDLSGGVGSSVLETARELQQLGPVQALFLAILGNTLLCLGVWLTYSARTTTDRILALTPPVVAFYAMGLEHAIAVMFYLPCAELIQLFDTTGAATLASGSALELGVADFLALLVPVTVGNILGGGVLVALVYWFVYLRPGPRSEGG
ncbi:formate/nitrite transporter family protein [Ectothiorhodospiraceae bacterium WFHF3C12]|nr:formate/nitrite transporter family protein [Ectothiorhodospiraceae bacterium WFHF3C12]